jgi:hypothetical protein
MGMVATLIRGEVQNEAQLIARIRAFDAWPVTLGTLPPEAERSSGPRHEPRPERRSEHRSLSPEGRADRPRSRDPGERSRRGGKGRGHGPARRSGEGGEKKPRGRRRERRKGPPPGE